MAAIGPAIFSLSTTLQGQPIKTTIDISSRMLRVDWNAMTFVHPSWLSRSLSSSWMRRVRIPHTRTYLESYRKNASDINENFLAKEHRPM